MEVVGNNLLGKLDNDKKGRNRERNEGRKRRMKEENKNCRNRGKKKVGKVG